MCRRHPSSAEGTPNGQSGFNASIALAQAAPGPNVLFVALLVWRTRLHRLWLLGAGGLLGYLGVV